MCYCIWLLQMAIKTARKLLIRGFVGLVIILCVAYALQQFVIQPNIDCYAGYQLMQAPELHAQVIPTHTLIISGEGPLTPSTKQKPAIDTPRRGAVAQTKRRCRKKVVMLMDNFDRFRDWIEYGNMVARFDNAPVDDATGLRTVHEACPKHACDLDIVSTSNISLMSNSDAIIVNIDKHFGIPAYQERAFPHMDEKTKWFVFSSEGANRYYDLKMDFTGVLFHYLVTYHTESDVWHPYSWYVPNEPTDTMPWNPTNSSFGKTGLMAWMASNCEDVPWPRFSYVKKLGKRLPIDIYGHCGTMGDCGTFQALKPSYMNKECMAILGRYKFYLALENCECDQFISAKFWDNSLRSGAVPIVYGGSRQSYERLAPPNSFIHIGDFNSMDKLVDYVKYLDKHDDKYGEYFRWRHMGRIDHYFQPMNMTNFVCRMVPFMTYDPAPLRLFNETEMYRGCINDGVVDKVPHIRGWKPRK